LRRVKKNGFPHTNSTISEEFLCHSFDLNMSHEVESIRSRRDSASGDGSGSRNVLLAMRSPRQGTDKGRRKVKDLSILEDEVLSWRRPAAEKEEFLQLIQSLNTITGSEKANKDDILPLLGTFYAFKNETQVFFDLDTYCKEVNVLRQQLQNLSAKKWGTFPLHFPHPNLTPPLFPPAPPLTAGREYHPSRNSNY
jgi:hypothetical protein